MKPYQNLYISENNIENEIHYCYDQIHRWATTRKKDF